MKLFLTLVLICSGLNSWAAKPNSNNDFSNSDTALKPITKDDMLYRSYIKGDIFITSPNGEKLIGVANESREWEFGGQDTALESNWVYQQKGLPQVALKHKWTIEGDGQISVQIQQYDKIERGRDREVIYGKLIKEEQFKLKDFSPIDWVISDSDHRLVVRLTPAFWPNSDPTDIGPLPINGKNIIIYDTNGQVWADQLTLDRASVYFSATTHKGSLYISFVPFKGAQVVGEAKNGRMKLKTGRGKLQIQSETPFVPSGVKAKVYGLFRFDEKTERLNSVRTSSSDREEEFVKRIQ